MARQFAHVFVASTRGALDPYRDAVERVCIDLSLMPLTMEHFSPNVRPSIETCYEQIDRADLLVLIIGESYGSRPESNSLSYTELEYEYAVHTRRLEVIAFIVREDDQQGSEESSIDARDRAALDRFRNRVTSAHTTTLLTGLGEFTRAVIRELAVQQRPPTGALYVKMSPRRNRPFVFNQMDYYDPHDLAVAFAANWVQARSAYFNGTFVGVWGGSNENTLAAWLEEIGDTSYPLNQLRDRQDANTADDRLLDFISRFAPDTPPSYQGVAASASALANSARRAYGGDRMAWNAIQQFNESKLRYLAKHSCVEHHEGCGSNGCNVIAAAWPLWERLRRELEVPLKLTDFSSAPTSPFDSARNRLTGNGRRASAGTHVHHARDQVDRGLRLQAGILLLVLDPTFREAVKTEGLAYSAPVRAAWLLTMRDQAMSATDLTGTATWLLFLELARREAEREMSERKSRETFAGFAVAAVVYLGLGLPIAGLVGTSRTTWPSYFVFLGFLASLIVMILGTALRLIAHNRLSGYFALMGTVISGLLVILDGSLWPGYMHLILSPIYFVIAIYLLIVFDS